MGEQTILCKLKLHSKKILAWPDGSVHGSGLEPVPLEASLLFAFPGRFLDALDTFVTSEDKDG